MCVEINFVYSLVEIEIDSSEKLFDPKNTGNFIMMQVDIGF